MIISELGMRQFTPKDIKISVITDAVAKLMTTYYVIDFSVEGVKAKDSDTQAAVIQEWKVGSNTYLFQGDVNDYPKPDDRKPHRPITMSCAVDASVSEPFIRDMKVRLAQHATQKWRAYIRRERTALESIALEDRSNAFICVEPCSSNIDDSLRKKIMEIGFSTFEQADQYLRILHQIAKLTAHTEFDLRYSSVFKMENSKIAKCFSFNLKGSGKKFTFDEKTTNFMKNRKWSFTEKVPEPKAKNNKGHGLEM